MDKRKPGRPTGDRMIRFRARVAEMLPMLGEFVKKSDLVNDMDIREIFPHDKIRANMVGFELKRLEAKGVLENINGAVGFSRIVRLDLL